MRAALQIAAKDLRLRMRDGSVFIFGIAAPLVLAFIFDLIFGGAIAGTGLGLSYGVVDLDRSQVSEAFVSVLEEAEAEDVLTVEAFSGRSPAEGAVEDGEIDAFILIPEGLGESVFSNQPATIEVIGDVDSPTATQIAVSFAERFSSGVASSQAAVATTSRLAGADFSGPQGDPGSAGQAFTLTDRAAETRQLDATTYLTAGMAVFFVFFIVQFGVTGLLDEEAHGTMPRLMAAPIPRVAVVGGKAIVSFVLGVASMAVLVVATSLLMGARWGSPLGVAVLVVAAVSSAVGIMGLVAAFAKTPEGAGNLGAIIAVVLGMLGGTFFPIGSAGGFLSNLTFITPHAWFLRGLADLSSDASWTEALPAAAAIFAFAIVTSAIAWALLRRKWAR